MRFLSRSVHTGKKTIPSKKNTVVENSWKFWPVNIDKRGTFLSEGKLNIFSITSVIPHRFWGKMSQRGLQCCTLMRKVRERLLQKSQKGILRKILDENRNHGHPRVTGTEPSVWILNAREQYMRRCLSQATNTEKNRRKRIVRCVSRLRVSIGF